MDFFGIDLEHLRFDCVSTDFKRLRDIFPQIVQISHYSVYNSFYNLKSFQLFGGKMVADDKK
jgi:hypothetical protein